MALLKRLLLSLLLLSSSSPVFAQAGGVASINLIDPSRFPQVSAAVSVLDEAGLHVSGLAASNFEVTESGQPVADLMVGEEETGVQIVFVLNTGASFSKRDSLGRTRWEHVRESIIRWTETDAIMPEYLDDVSVIVPEGPIVSHTTKAGAVREALLAHAPGFGGAESSIALLQQGLDFALDSSPRPGMRRIVVVLSSALDGVTETQLSDLAAQARDSQVTVHTAYVGPTGSQGTQGALNLNRLAELAGGAFAFVDYDTATLAPMYSRVAAERMQYVLVYRSLSPVSGTRRVDVHLQSGPLSLTAPSGEYSITIEPPQVLWGDLPDEVTVQPDGTDSANGDASPPMRAVTVRLEFPDGHSRAITRSVLFVDGQPVAENTAPPFDTFQWDLSGYTETGEHRLQVVAVDQLGIQGQSDEGNVMVKVPAVPMLVVGGDWQGLIRPLALAALALAAMAGSVASAVAFRRRWAALAAAPPASDVEVRQTPRKPTAPRPAPRGRRPFAGAAQKTGKAYLEILEGGQGVIEVIEPIVRLGRDSAVAQAVFADRSVSRLHARMAEINDCVFYLYDEGSTSGTWVNFEQVPMAGVPLNHGDLINLGRVQLRFNLRSQADAPASPTPTATPAPRDDIPTGPTLPMKPVRPGRDDRASKR